MNELKLIEEYYGKDMKKMCEVMFPDILKEKGVLLRILETNFAHTKFLCEDIKECKLEEKFKNFIYQLVKSEKNPITTNESPIEVFQQIGYVLYEIYHKDNLTDFAEYYCDSDIDDLKEKISKGTKIFIAVRTPLLNIKDWDPPLIPGFIVEDEWKPRIIRIEFTKADSSAPLNENRYNCTYTLNGNEGMFGNNLDEIEPGLNSAFENKYDCKINKASRFIDDKNFKYVKARNGKYYKYNYNIWNEFYFGPNNIIADSELVISDENNERYLVLDHILIDLIEKDFLGLFSANLFYSIGEIESIDIKENNKRAGKIVTINDNIIIKLDEYNQIVEYINPVVEEIGDHFLEKSNAIEVLRLDNVKKIGDAVLADNKTLKSFIAPRVEFIGNSFCENNNSLEELILPECKSIGSSFLEQNNSIKRIFAPKLEYIDRLVLKNHNNELIMYAPEIRVLKDNSFENNHEIKVQLYKTIFDNEESWFYDSFKLTKRHSNNTIASKILNKVKTKS